MPKTRLLFILTGISFVFVNKKRNEKNPIDCRHLFINRIYCVIKLDLYTEKSIKDPFYS